jgi:hypothetical protein
VFELGVILSDSSARELLGFHTNTTLFLSGFQVTEWYDKSIDALYMQVFWASIGRRDDQQGTDEIQTSYALWRPFSQP